MSDYEEAKETLIEYLNAHVEFGKFLGPRPDFKYPTLPELVYKEGELLSNEPLSEEEENFLLVVLRRSRFTFRVRECYMNAARISMEASIIASEMKVEYGEGIACSNVVPVEHAVMVLNGKPVDLTWRQYRNRGNYAREPNNLLKRIQYNISHHAYYMLRFPVKYLIKEMVRTGTYGVTDFNQELSEKGMAAVWE